MRMLIHVGHVFRDADQKVWHHFGQPSYQGTGGNSSLFQVSGACALQSIFSILFLKISTNEVALVSFEYST